MNGLVLLQKAIRARLVATSAVTALVPAANIVDTKGIPAAFPSILLGDDQAVQRNATIGLPSSLGRYLVDIYTNVHIWTRGGGLILTKEVAAAVQRALFVELAIEGYGPTELDMTTIRFLRDPDGISGHGILSFRTLWQEAY